MSDATIARPRGEVPIGWLWTGAMWRPVVVLGPCKRRPGWSRVLLGGTKTVKRVLHSALRLAEHPPEGKP